MEEVYKGYDYFRRNLYPRKRRFYRKLEKGQNPKQMFILCSDSRKCLREVLGVRPGCVFCARNPGNVVPVCGTTLGGDEAAIEYGVLELQVEDVVVLGHSGCGAMKALHAGPEKLADRMPAVSRMLCNCGTDPSLVRGSKNELRDLTRLHAKTQMDNLLTYPFIRSAVDAGKLKLHAWVFQIGNGMVLRYNPDTGEFEPLPEGALDSMKQPARSRRRRRNRCDHDDLG